MKKKSFICKHFLVSFLLFAIIVCSFPSITHAGWFYYKSDAIKIGDEFHKKINIGSDEETTRVNNMAQELLKSIPKKKYNYEFYTTTDKAPNAFAAPGGKIYMTSGMLQFATSPSERAFTLAHELGHQEGDHWIKSMDKIMFTQLVIEGAMDDNKWKNAVSLAAVALVSRGYGFDKEHEADKYAFDLLTKTPKYNIVGGIVLFERLRDKYGDGGGKDIGNWINPHPYNATRIAKQKEYIKKYVGQNIEIRDDNSIWVNGEHIVTYIAKPDDVQHTRFSAIYAYGNIAQLIKDKNYDKLEVIRDGIIGTRNHHNQETTAVVVPSVTDLSGMSAEEATEVVIKRIKRGLEKVSKEI